MLELAPPLFGALAHPRLNALRGVLRPPLRLDAVAFGCASRARGKNAAEADCLDPFAAIDCHEGLAA